MPVASVESIDRASAGSFVSPYIESDPCNGHVADRHERPPIGRPLESVGLPAAVCGE